MIPLKMADLVVFRESRSASSAGAFIREALGMNRPDASLPEATNSITSKEK